MNARHVNFAVDDLAAGIRFYSAMFASAPAVIKPDCAKWTLDASRVSVTIFRSDAAWQLASSGTGFFVCCVAGLRPSPVASAGLAQ